MKTDGTGKHGFYLRNLLFLRSSASLFSFLLVLAGTTGRHLYDVCLW